MLGFSARALNVISSLSELYCIMPFFSSRLMASSMVSIDNSVFDISSALVIPGELSLRISIILVSVLFR